MANPLDTQKRMDGERAATIEDVPDLPDDWGRVPENPALDAMLQYDEAKDRVVAAAVAWAEAQDEAETALTMLRRRRDLASKAALSVAERRCTATHAALRSAVEKLKGGNT